MDPTKRVSRPSQASKDTEQQHNHSQHHDDEDHPPAFHQQHHHQEQPEQHPEDHEPRSHRSDHHEFYHDELPLKKRARITTTSNIYHDDDDHHFYSNGDHDMHRHHEPYAEAPMEELQYQQPLQHQQQPQPDQDDRKPAPKPSKQQQQQQQPRQVDSVKVAAVTGNSNNNNHHHHSSHRHHPNNDDNDHRVERQLVSSSDRIILDVGGTEMVTSLRTLTSNSSYFASVFSNTWLAPERPFLDQDPELFKILLNFMRSGYIEEQVLTKPLLLQAAYLGMDRLLQAVMILAYRNSHPNFTGNDQDAMQAFGTEYGDIVQATCQGHLPALLFRSSQEPPKEYASLYFHKAKVPIPHMVAPQYRTGIRTSVLQTPECATLTNSNNLMLEWSDAGGYFLPVFALNYLGKRGFTLADTDLQGFWDPRRLDDESEEIALGLDSPRQLGRLLGEVLFVRYQEQSNSNTTPNEYYDDSVTNVILTSRPKKRWTAEPKEYATVNYVKCVDGCVFIQAAGGNPRRVPRLAGEYLRDTGRLMCKSIALAMDWLQQHGFTHNEPQLEALLTRIGNEAKDDYYGPTMVFSRPLNEKEPLLPCRLVNVDFAEETSHLRGHAARHG